MIALIATKLPVAIKLGIVSIFGLLGFAIGERWSGSVGLGLGCQAVATVLAAFLMKRDKVAAIRSGHQLNLLDRLINEQTEHAKMMRERVQQLNRLTAVLTITKHAMARAMQHYQTALDMRDMLLREQKIDPPRFRPIDFGEITEVEDKLRIEIAGMGPDVVARMRGAATNGEDTR